MIIAYDGKNYRGWQLTRMGPSIEESLKAAIEKILQHPVQLEAASRTDAGVHALRQVVRFFTSRSSPDLTKLCHSLNCLLPPDIIVHSVDEAPHSFHPTLDCFSKEYRYYLCLGPAQLPHHRFYSWHIPYPLNLALIRDALPDLMGQHHFAAFRNSKKNAPRQGDLRDIQELELIELEGKRLCVRLKANRFLYKMARNLVGTLVYIGLGKIDRQALSHILQSRHRPLAGVTAPAHGLFLHEVFY